MLECKTRGNASPQGRPRVYFCCHRDDFNNTFDRITNEILDIQRNAAIWYRDPEHPFVFDEALRSDLSQMQLFVIPVTSNFLFTEDPARIVEFAFAEENHIPVLPLMQEPGLEADFNIICGDLQFLDKNAAKTDATALPYKDKLERFLGAVLVDDKTAERIRKAFDAYIFLSYRKKDRAAAQKVMQRIHQIKACRDMAIWYDEFLTPGENFNDEIEEALRKSSLFTMVVTPSLLEDPNYVQTTEYPAAVDMGMKTLPVEAEETDDIALREMYEGIGECFPLGDPVAIASRLRELMKDVVFGTNRDDPEHVFLMGLAYLSGIDVEVDHSRAVSMIASAAEDGGLPEAYEKMVSMFRTGDAVERDYDEAIAWQEEYAGKLEEKAEEEQTAEAYQDCFKALAYLEQYQADQDEMEDAYETALRIKTVAEKLGQTGQDNGLWELSVAYERLGDICFDWEEISDAADWYEKALETRETIAEEKNTFESWSDLGYSYSRMGDICRAEGRFDEALEWYEKELNIRQSDGSEDGRKPLADTYNKIGDLYGSAGRWEEARNWYEKDMEISRAVYEETGTYEAAQDLAVSYGRLGFMSAAADNNHEARYWYEKDLELSRKAYYETDTLGSLWNLAVVYEYMGDLCASEGDLKEAREWYEKCESSFDDITDISETIEAHRNQAGICIKLGDLFALMGNSRVAQEWYERDREINLAVATSEAEDADDEDGGVSIESMERLAYNSYKLGTLEGISAAERKNYLEELVRIGTALYNTTGEVRHQNYMLAGLSELDRL